MKIDMKTRLIIFCMSMLVVAQSCSSTAENLVTKSYIQDGKKFIVQQLPPNFNDNDKAAGLKYYRLIIDSDVKFGDSADANYINFGVQDHVRMVRNNDSIAPVFMQRIANGRETMFEYIMAFESGTPAKTGYDICMDDEVFGFGKVSVKF